MPQEDSREPHVHGAAAGNIKTCRIVHRDESATRRGAFAPRADTLHAPPSVPSSWPERKFMLVLSAAGTNAIIHSKDGMMVVLKWWYVKMCAEWRYAGVKVWKKRVFYCGIVQRAFEMDPVFNEPGPYSFLLFRSVIGQLRKALLIHFKHHGDEAMISFLVKRKINQFIQSALHAEP